MKSLQIRLSLWIAGVLALVLAAALAGQVALNGAIAFYQDDYSRSVLAQQRILDVTVEFKTQVQEWKNVLLRGHEPKALNKYWAAFEKLEQHIQTESKELTAQLPEGPARGLVQDFARTHAEMGQAYRRGLAAYQAAAFDPKAGDAAAKGMDRAPTDLLIKAEGVIRAQAQAAVQTAADQSSTAIRWSWAALIVSCALGLGVAVLIARQVIRVLGAEPEQAVAVAAHVADGDLARVGEAAVPDSLMGHLVAMRDRLHAVVTDVMYSAMSVQAASEEIAAGNSDLSNRTVTQVGALEKSASAMQVLGLAVQENAASAQRANSQAELAAQVATHGGEVVGTAVATMGTIQESSRRINDIIGVIDGIAFQTNILALNAAVEAARAGESGRGFAVVAAEVRRLAQRSAEAAREIKQLIDASVASVSTGTEQVNRAGAAMQEVVVVIHSLSDTVGQIAIESGEQAQTVGQIATIVGQISSDTHHNAALVEQMAASAQQLSNEAQTLAGAVSYFKLGAEAGAGRAMAPPLGLAAPKVV